MFLEYGDGEHTKFMYLGNKSFHMVSNLMNPDGTIYDSQFTEVVNDFSRYIEGVQLTQEDFDKLIHTCQLRIYLDVQPLLRIGRYSVERAAEIMNAISDAITTGRYSIKIPLE
jgi:hypothetical protein